MRAHQVMIVHKLYNMLDAIMFAYMYRGKVYCLEQLYSTGMREVYYKVRSELIALHPVLKKSGCPLAEYCTKASKSRQRDLLKKMDI